MVVVWVSPPLCVRSVSFSWPGQATCVEPAREDEPVALLQGQLRGARQGNAGSLRDHRPKFINLAGTTTVVHYLVRGKLPGTRA